MEKIRLADLERHYPGVGPVLANRLRELFQTADEAERWLHTSHPFLLGSTPADFIRDGKMGPVMEMLEENERLT